MCGLDGSRGMEGNIFPIKFFLMIPGIKLQLKPVAASGLQSMERDKLFFDLFKLYRQYQICSLSV